MTNEQINRMAAEAMGIERWPPETENPRDGLCERCGELVHKRRISYPDFCDDLNAAQRLVNDTVANGRRERLRDYGHAMMYASPYEQLFLDEILLLPAKTITLACLVALGKVTLEEAKESL